MTLHNIGAKKIRSSDPSTKSGHGSYRLAATSVPWWPAVAGGVLILIGILLGTAPPTEIFGIPNKVSSLFLTELGFAFLIAYILSVSIERRGRDERDKIFRAQVDTVSRNVMEAIYKRDVPQAYFNFIEKYVIAPEFYRESLSITLELTRSNKNDYITLKSTARYKVRNITREPDTYLVRSSIERPFKKQELARLNKLVVGETTFDQPEQIEKLIVSSGKAPMIEYQHPLNMDAGEECWIELVTTTVKHLHDYEFWRPVTASDGMVVRIVCDPIFEFHITSVHPDPLKHTQGEEGDRLHEWQIESPLLPFQGVLVWWTLKEESGATAPVESPVRPEPQQPRAQQPPARS